MKAFNVSVRESGEGEDWHAPYTDYAKENNLNNIIVSHDELVNDLHAADLVFGDSSYAMHLAILVGKRVYCSIPISNAKSSLPHEGLGYLRETDV